jgi:hypothetical protein
LPRRAMLSPIEAALNDMGFINQHFQLIFIFRTPEVTTPTIAKKMT